LYTLYWEAPHFALKLVLPLLKKNGKRKSQLKFIAYTLLYLDFESIFAFTPFLDVFRGESCLDTKAGIYRYG